MNYVNGDTPNEIGYLIYLWDRNSYNFVSEKYNPNNDYTKYLKYYKDESKNEKLIKFVLENK